MSVVGEIVRTTFRQELRMPRGSTGARGRRGGLIGSLAVFVFSGFITAASIARGVDHFTAGMLSSTVFMLLFAIFVVMEFAVIVTGPDDLAFYLPLPVPARAYVSAKIAVVLLFGCAFTVAFALPPLLILGLTGA
ncbi:MAG TPA: hypothetical protein VL359_09550, partial [bacterium]|nr:hypothetical protein [bacterium]